MKGFLVQTLSDDLQYASVLTNRESLMFVFILSDLDEQTQIALALSASMAPPLPPDAGEGKTGKRKGKKNKG